MSPKTNANEEPPKIIQPVHESTPMLPANRSRCHFAKKYRTNMCGRFAASNPRMATIPKTSSGKITLGRILHPLEITVENRDYH